MSEEAILNNDTTTKGSRFSALKIAILVILGLSIIGIISTSILYFSNNKIRDSINSVIKSTGIVKSENEIEKEQDDRMKELAVYYILMDTQKSSEKLFSLKQEDKKLYEEMISYMMGENVIKTTKIRDEIKLRESKSDTLKREYDIMKKEMEDNNNANSTHYTSLGVKGAINAIEESLTYNMDFTAMAKNLEKMQPQFSAKLLHYMNYSLSSELELSLNKEYLYEVLKEKDKYREFIRKNTSLADFYNKVEKSIAAKELEDATKFTVDDLGLIFSKMDYFKSAQILNNFADDSYVVSVLESIKNYEDLEMTYNGNLSKTVAQSIKVLEEYEKDVENLVKAYEKMQAADLAQVIDIMTSQNPSYKEYIIDENRKFRISEKEMIVQVLKQSKPIVVSRLLAELKNTDKVQKAALLSKELGIPNP